MSDAISIAKLSMLVDWNQMSQVSHNVANLNTNGFKSSYAARESFETLLNQASAVSPAQVNAAYASQFTTPYTPEVAGSLKSTGSPLDLMAVEGGYFAMSLDGKTVLSKGGRFQIDESGRLVNQAGAVLLGSSGPLVVGSNGFSVLEGGEVFVEGRQIGTLPTYQIDRERGSLNYLSAGMYDVEGAYYPASSVKVMQGVVEESNVKLSQEMVSLVEVTRHFESSQRVIKAYDEMMTSALSLLAD